MIVGKFGYIGGRTTESSPTRENSMASSDEPCDSRIVVPPLSLSLSLYLDSSAEYNIVLGVSLVRVVALISSSRSPPPQNILICRQTPFVLIRIHNPQTLYRAHTHCPFFTTLGKMLK